MPPRIRFSGEIYEPNKPAKEIQYVFRRTPNIEKPPKDRERRREIAQCGSYNMDTILVGTKIIECHGVFNFKFYTKLVSDEQHEIMNETPTMKLPTKRLAYASNHYHSDLYAIKLYQKSMGQVYRAKIMDLYNQADCQGYRLSLRCDILLLDTGEYLTNISYDCIYDYSLMIDCLKKIPPEVKSARLALAGNIESNIMKKLNEKFCNIIRNKGECKFNIKILDYKENTYLVDLIDDRKNSLISMMMNEYPLLRPESLESEPHSMLGYSEMEPRQSSRNMKTNGDANPGKPCYFGAYGYFKSKLRSLNNNDRETSYDSKRLFKVRIVDKSDPNSIHIIPADEDYLKFHTKFKQELERIPSLRDADKLKSQEYRPFYVGEPIIYKPRHQDEPKIGRWLRGVVIKISKYSKFGLPKCSTSNPDEVADETEIYRMIKMGYMSPDQIIYGIRSVDYGFQTVATFRTMRHLTSSEFRQFTLIWPWSMRCNLFGVYSPCLEQRKNEMEEKKFSRLCLDMIDCWIRERTHEDSPLAYFKVLFRDDILKVSFKDVFIRPFNVSLFYREEPVFSRGPIKTPYDCLNSYLVDRGFASDTVPGTGVSSNIQLDEHVINVLVSHGRI